MTRVAEFIVAGPRGDTIPTTATLAAELTNNVDFPAFVSALVQGVFQAMVGASVQQMDAYRALLDEATKAIDAYVQHDDDDDATSAAPATRRRAHADRQQLLATMVLMGINRIVVTDGVVKARVRFDLAPAPPSAR